MEQMTEEVKRKLDEISKKMGISIEKLLHNKSAKTIIEEYETGALKVLND